MKKIYSFFVLLTLLFCYTGNVWGDEPLTLKILTTAANENEKLPIWSYNAGGCWFHSQILYPATVVEGNKTLYDMTALDGKKITALSFDAETTSQSWGSGTFTVSVKQLDDVSSLSGYVDITGATTVYEGQLSVSSSSLTITFSPSANVIYDKTKYLLLDIQTKTKGSYGSHVYFWGKNTDGSYSYSGYNTGSTGVSGISNQAACYFIPRTTFTYEVVAPACADPTDVTARVASGTSATIAWTDAAASAWQVQYSSDGGENWSDPVDATTNPFTLTGLTENTTYNVQVRANCGEGDGNKSEWVDAESTVTPTSCPSVTGVTLSSGTYNSITVNWSLSGTTNCDVQYKAGSGEWQAAETNTSATSKNISGLAVGTEYSFQVKPNCSADGWVDADETYTPAYGIPSPSISSKTDAQATVTWSAVTGADSYEYVVMPGTTAANWTNPETTVATSATLTGLTGGTSYTIYVRSVYGSNKSSEASAAFTTTTIAPNTPTVDDKDASSATLSWTNSGAATQYQWACKTSGTPSESDWSTASTATSAEVTGLSGNTNYTFYVRSYYGSSESQKSAYASQTFKTDCGVYSLKFEQNFSSSNPACWDVSNYTTSYAWEPASTKKVSGYSMDFYANNASDKYADLVTPSIYLSEDANLTFQLWNYNSVSGKVLINNGTETTELINSLPATASSSNVFYLQTKDLSAYTGETVKFIFRCYGKNSYVHLYIDDVVVDAKPCDAPTSLTKAENPTGAVISWSAGGTEDSRYQWACVAHNAGEPAEGWTLLDEDVREVTITGKTTGTTYDCYVRSYCSSTKHSTASMISFTPQCLAPTGLAKSAVSYNSATLTWTGSAKNLRYKTGSNAWTTVSVSGTSHTISGLNAETTYQAQVQASCATGDEEAWTASVSITTKCEPATIVKGTPFEEDFASSSLPSCWEKSDGSYPQISSGSLQFYGNTGTSFQQVALPCFTNDIEGLTISFDHKNTYSSASYAGTLNIGYIKTDGSFVSRASVVPGSSYATYSAAITKANAEDNVANYAIRYTASYDYARVYIDNVVIEITPTCFVPAAIANASSITSDGATLSWTASGHGETSYQWAVAEGSAAPVWVDDEAHKVNNTTSKVLTGLEANTAYTFYVRSYCGADDQSEAVSKAFTTSCGKESLPFEYGFEDAANAQMPSCWKALYASGYYAYAYTTNPHTGSKSLDILAPKTSGNETVVVLPEIDADLNKLGVSFFHRGTAGASIEVGYVTNPDDKATFVTVGEAITVAASYEQAFVSFESLGDVTGNVSIRCKGTSDEANFYIDDIRVLENLTFADGTDNTDALIAANGKRANVTIERTIYCDGDYNTLCLPFSLATLEGTPLEDATVYAYKYAVIESEELLVRIYETENGIQAGVPYLLTMTAANDITSMTFTNVTISAAEGKTIGTDEAVEFIGILKPEAFTAGDETTLFVSTNNNLAWANTNASLKSFRAFFKRNASSPAPLRPGMRARIVRYDVTTGVDGAKSNGVQCIKLIENEQLVIIRNGVKYNVQGQIIR